jgi:hypothetical protein
MAQLVLAAHHPDYANPESRRNQSRDPQAAGRQFQHRGDGPPHGGREKGVQDALDHEDEGQRRNEFFRQATGTGAKR